jgi:peptide/nickel transport system substrate-binding protein
MRKTVLYLMGMLAIVSMVLAACGPTAATPTPQVVVQTQVVKETQLVPQVVKETQVVPATPEPSAVAYERSETLYTGGTQWGPPSSWNPFNQGNYAMGTIGLVYETPFIYDPLTNEYTPWLAESGKWADPTTYEMKVRPGIYWSDGKPFTADDVAFTFELGKKAAIFYSPVWGWLTSIDKVDDSTLSFKFKEPLYQEWAWYLYNVPMLPKHLWESKTADEIATGTNENPIGTGPYKYETYDQSRMVWAKNDTWWAKDALGLDPKPKRIVDIVNPSNPVALGMVLQGGYDLNNNFLPGVATLVKGGYGIQTYYSDAPYHLSANTAWLIMNTTKKPMDDPAFRKAMAFAVDTDQIVQVVYGNMVQKANPTGLLPVWDEYVDQTVVKELGFSYDTAKAKQLLTAAGYKDVDGDGFVEAPDGSKIALKIIVPFGWTDWMESIKVVSSGAQAVGINLAPDYPDYGAYLSARLGGSFEMAIDNQAQLSNTPWRYYDWIYQNPLADIETMQNGNYGRYDNKEAFDLVDQLDKTQIDDAAGMKTIISKLQRIQLTDMPMVPLWYNGMWSQVNTSVWTNWPSSAEGANHWLPSSWRGYWNMTGIRMLTELKPAPKPE